MMVLSDPDIVAAETLKRGGEKKRYTTVHYSFLTVVEWSGQSFYLFIFLAIYIIRIIIRVIYVLFFLTKGLYTFLVLRKFIYIYIYIMFLVVSTSHKTICF